MLPPRLPMDTAPLRIREADSSADLDTARRLFREYAAWLEVDLCFQGFEDELAGLPGKYAPPGGVLLLAEDAAGNPAGCVAVRPLSDDSGGRMCELKRLWVRPGYRGLNAGRSLTSAALAAARAMGYATIKLDTMAGKMAPAVALYRALGFTECAPYCYNPVADVIYLEYDLRPTPPANIDPGSNS